MNYKLVVTDMDGTLLNDDHEVSRKNKDALKKVIDSGKHVAIATGRIYTAARVYAKTLELVTPIICCNGAIIKNLEDDTILYGNPIDDDLCRKVIDICYDEDVYFHFYSEDTIIGQVLKNKLLFFSEWTKTLKEEDRLKVDIVEDAMAWIGTDKVYKFSIQDDDQERLNRIGRRIRRELNVDAYKSYYNMLDVMSKGVSKGNAILKLAEIMDINSDEIIAIGDNENDISMMHAAGLGVAMENADEKIKIEANFITDTNNNDGVAKVIERYML